MNIFIAFISITAFFAILSNVLSLFAIPYFEAKFSIVKNVNQVRRFRELKLFTTESLHESTRLEQALLKVIPKIP